MAERGLDIRPHRKRMVEEDLEEKFKDPQDPFRHRLRLLDVDDRVRRAVAVDRLPRQAAAQPHADADDHPRQPSIPGEEQRADRRLRRCVPQSPEGARDLRDRRASRARCRSRRRARSSRRSRSAVNDLRAFCAARDVDLDALGRLKGFELVAAGKQTVEMLMVDDDEKIAFLSRAALVDRLYKAILPDTRANEFSRVRAVSSSSRTGSPPTPSGPTSLASWAESSSFSTSPSPPRST